MCVGVGVDGLNYIAQADSDGVHMKMRITMLEAGCGIEAKNKCAVQTNLIRVIPNAN